MVCIQFFRVDRNQSDEILSSDFTRVFDVPQNILRILKTSCYDCHSNNTGYPWYSSIQPGAWIMSNHIKEGKEELNFSEFGLYSARRKRNKLKSIASQLREDDMPLCSYTLLHEDAKLSEGQKKILIDWVNMNK
jgi:Haem-binding domain